MSQVEKIKIFLASPGDVYRERKHVQDVVTELNQSYGSNRGITLEVICSEKNTFPGYGKDGQAILNDQIGDMKEYDLFVGIMWNRIGTRTPRDSSGTVEEFSRAITSLRRRKKPEVWFYFRNGPANLNTDEALSQKAEVLKFVKRFKRGNGYYKEYSSHTKFRQEFFNHLLLWLGHREKGKPTQSNSKGTQRKRLPLKKQTARVPSDQSKKSVISSVGRSQGTKAQSKRNSHSTEITNPGKWMMINNMFFQAESTKARSNGSISLVICPKNLEESNKIQALHSDSSYWNSPYSYADIHTVGSVRITSLEAEIILGKSTLNLELEPIKSSQSNSYNRFSFGEYSPGKIAELRIRNLLLGEALPEGLDTLPLLGSMSRQSTSLNSANKGIFSLLKAGMPPRSRHFSQKAWLWAIYQLKINQLIEEVLELKLGSVKNNMMSVQLRGKNRSHTHNQAEEVIRITGRCDLSP